MRYLRNYNVTVSLSCIVQLFLCLLRHWPVITISSLLRIVVSQNVTKDAFLPRKRSAICYKLNTLHVYALR